MSTLNDLMYAWFSAQAGVPTGIGLSAAEIAFYQSVVANPAGKSIDDLSYAYYIGVLSGNIVIGGETPTTTVLSVPSQVASVVGSPAGSVTIKKYSDRTEYTFNITAAATWSFDIPYSANNPAPRNNIFWEHDVPGGTVQGSNGDTKLQVQNFGAPNSWSGVKVAYLT